MFNNPALYPAGRCPPGGGALANFRWPLFPGERGDRRFRRDLCRLLRGAVWPVAVFSAVRIFSRGRLAGGNAGGRGFQTVYPTVRLRKGWLTPCRWPRARAGIDKRGGQATAASLLACTPWSCGRPQRARDPLQFRGPSCVRERSRAIDHLGDRETKGSSFSACREACRFILGCLCTCVHSVS